ncbi:duplicated orphan permease [bacterium A37T11]|nr:duplicated orphan permease [bacterium A37T11]
MIKNLFKITLRHLWRRKLFTILNIVGLSIGISACWVIYLMVDYEFSFDKHQPDAGRVFQVVSRMQTEDGRGGGRSAISKGLLPAITGAVSGIELVAPAYYRYSESAKTQGTANKEPLWLEEPAEQIGTRPDYFRLLGYKWLSGEPEHALDAPDKIVLTRSRANQYFPNWPVDKMIGQTIIYNDTLSVSVSGVVADLVSPNSFPAQEFFAISSQDMSSTDWSSVNSNELLFIKLRKEVTPAQVLKQINALNIAHNKAEFEKYKYRSWYELLPLPDKHFATEYGWHTRTANKSVLFGLVGVGFFLLALACINYINLSTAQLPERAREIGVRKTLGDTPYRLILQFLIETLLITLMALLLSVLLAQLALHLFSGYIPEGMLAYSNIPGLLAFGTILILAITLLSGLYPAWLVTRVQTVQVLKGQVQKMGKGQISMRKALVVFQFAFAQVFVICAVIMGQQLHFSLTKDPGFDHEAVLQVQIPYKLRQDPALKNRELILKRELKKRPEIESVSLGDIPMSDGMNASLFIYKSDSGDVQQQVMLKNVDADYLDLYKMDLLAGKNLEGSDTVKEYIINETALKAFGFSSPQAAIGKRLYNYDGQKSLPITGVVRDYHEFSMKSKIDAAAFISSVEWGLGTLNIKLPPAHPEAWGKAIQRIGEAWHQQYPQAPFEYHFYDETIASLYEQEQQTAKLINAAMTVTILISCLGLFGLAKLTASQRTKEIGIRKVLGASVSGIFAMLSKDFVKLVCLGLVIASPIAWWAMNQWLNDFAYRITIQWWMFALAGSGAILIALLTVGFQAIKAAVVNPVDSLRDE